MIQKGKRCGTCAFAKVSPQVMAQDISRRICYGVPPHAYYRVGPGGKEAMQMLRPIISVSDDACALHAEKDAEALVHEHEEMARALGVSDAPAGTRQ